MMSVKVVVYDKCKYDLTSEKVAEVEYEDIKGYEVVTGEKATEIGNTTDENSRDDFNEYLIIKLADGDEATFRNSYVDMFRF